MAFERGALERESFRITIVVMTCCAFQERISIALSDGFTTRTEQGA